MINAINPKKSVGPDGIHPFVLKECVNAFSNPLTLLFNKSIYEGVVHISWKTPNITPLFKNGSRNKHGFTKGKSCKTNLLEYMDIVTTCVANGKLFDILYTDFKKAFDKVSHRWLALKLEIYGIISTSLKWIIYFLSDRKQRVVLGESKEYYIIEYLNTSTKILYTKLFGLKKNISTEHTIIQLVREISESFEKKQYTLGVYIDLSKTFDTVDHIILLRKLKYYGIDNNMLKWFYTYLSYKKQFVTSNNGLQSDYAVKTCGVQQCSFLGPLMFLIYINDLSKAGNLRSIRNIRSIMFADDTNSYQTVILMSCFIT
nr:uncharacterized protein LOC124816149 [Hydra vulgaris]